MVKFERFIELLLNLSDELLELFEFKNINIYKRLISIRHEIRITKEDDFLGIEDFLSKEEIKTKIIKKDISFLNNTRFESDVWLIWRELSNTNRTLMWEWIDKIVYL